jgi:hypothetical protein
MVGASVEPALLVIRRQNTTPLFQVRIFELGCRYNLRGRAVARGPQPPQIFGPPPAPAGFWVVLAAVGLAIAAGIGTIAKEIATRWRGVVIAHLFFLTLWMALQVFLFATGAYWCLPNNSSTPVEWFTKYFAHVARCGAVPQTSPAFQGSIAVAAPAPAPIPAKPPVAVPVPVPPPPPPPPRAQAPALPAAPPPAATAPAGPAQGWSGRMVQNCWRNRAVDGGDCYENTYPPRRPTSAPPRPAVRHYRYVEPPPPYPCRRSYDCWPDDYYWRDDFGGP